MIKLKGLITENEELTLDELALQVNKDNKEIKKAMRVLLMIGHDDFDDQEKVKDMKKDLIDFLNNKLFKKYGKDVEIR